MRDTSGITLKHTRTSVAFSLITCIVGELIFDANMITPPCYAGVNMNKETFLNLKSLIFEFLNDKKEKTLNLEYSMLFYQLIDLVCKCMLDETDDILKDLAKKNLEIEHKDYERVRLSYIRYAQALIRKMNREFQSIPEFVSMITSLKR